MPTGMPPPETPPRDEVPEVAAGSPIPGDATGRIARAKARAEQAKQAGAKLVEREQTRRKSVRVAVDAYDRDRRFAGGVLAGGLAFRFFLWLLPLSLVAVTALQGFSENLDEPASELARSMGMSVAVAGSVATAADASGHNWAYLLVVGLTLVLWAGIGVVKAMRLVSGLAWEVDPHGAGNTSVESAWLAAIAVAISVAHQTVFRTGDGSLAAEITVVLVESALLTGVVIWVFSSLPHIEGIGWKAMIPGALLVTVGIALTRLGTIIYLAGKLDRIDDLYGALGLAAAFLGWLFIIGRLVVAGISLNASTHRASIRT